MATLNALFQGGPLRVDPTNKMTISFQPSGSAAKIKFSKIKVSPDKPFSVLITHVRTSLGLKNEDSIFLYAQQAYMPDEEMLCHDLNLLCGIDNVVTLHYSTEAVWG